MVVNELLDAFNEFRVRHRHSYPHYACSAATTLSSHASLAATPERPVSFFGLRKDVAINSAATRKAVVSWLCNAENVYSAYLA